MGRGPGRKLRGAPGTWFHPRMPWDFWLIFFVLGVLLPLRGRMRLKKLMEIPRIGTRERFSLYASTIAFQWVAAVVVAWRAGERGLTLDALGLVVHGRWRNLIAAIVGAATLGGLQWLNLRRMGRSPGKAREFMRILAERILPQAPSELIAFMALAISSSSVGADLAPLAVAVWCMSGAAAGGVSAVHANPPKPKSAAPTQNT